jgi:hypothetical protein
MPNLRTAFAEKRKTTAKTPPSRRLWYSNALGGRVFADEAQPAGRFVVRVVPSSGFDHVLVVVGYSLISAEPIERDDLTFTVDAAPMELFRVNAGNGYVTPRPAGVSTGVLRDLHEQGFLGSGRIDGAWLEYLTLP